MKTFSKIIFETDDGNIFCSDIIKYEFSLHNNVEKMKVTTEEKIKTKNFFIYTGIRKRIILWILKRLL